MEVGGRMCVSHALRPLSPAVMWSAEPAVCLHCQSDAARGEDDWALCRSDKGRQCVQFRANQVLLCFFFHMYMYIYIIYTYIIIYHKLTMRQRHCESKGCAINRF